jgi:hypothetical protein
MSEVILCVGGPCDGRRVLQGIPLIVGWEIGRILARHI